jgi:hypothetical protein
MLFLPQANLASEKSLTNCRKSELQCVVYLFQNHLSTVLAREAANPKAAVRRP